MPTFRDTTWHIELVATLPERWAIGDGGAEGPNDGRADARSLYDKLERVVLPLYYGKRALFIQLVMRAAIALNASFFNTERMINQYVTKAYFK